MGPDAVAHHRRWPSAARWVLYHDGEVTVWESDPDHRGDRGYEP